MRVDIKIVCSEYTGGFGGGAVEVPDGATLRQAVEACLEEAGAEPVEDLFAYTIYLRNAKPAQLDDALGDGDKVHVLRKVMGG